MRLMRWLVVIGLMVAGWGAWTVAVPYGSGQETFVEIAPGTGTAGIAAKLADAGVIRSAWAFEAVRVWRQGTLKAGEYRFDHAASALEVYDRLRRGDVYTIEVRVPEGFNIFDVAGAVGQAGLVERGAFLRAEMRDTALVRTWSPHATSVEGYLYPDTYRFGRHATADQILAVMVKRFAQQMERMGVAQSDTARLVTMASLVEKEVKVDAERPLVAGVFENRLAKGMPLQTDPTVIYASELAGTWTGAIHRSELNAGSAYNTYAHVGLPPGPICNPGLAALRAAMHPAATTALYFVADGAGATRFSENLTEHNGKVQEYRSRMR